MNFKQNAGGVNIFDAVESNEPKKIDRFAKSGGDLNIKNIKGSTPLWVALSEKKKESYEALLKNGADPNVIMSGKRVVTHWAALNNEDSWWLKLALENGADPNLVNVGRGSPGQGTPLRFATTSGLGNSTPGPLIKAKLLVEHGADINKPDRYNAYPLSMALDHGELKMVLYLLDQGADYNISQSRGDKFLVMIKRLIRMRDNYLIKERRDEIDTIREWMEAHNIDITEE